MIIVGSFKISQCFWKHFCQCLRHRKGTDIRPSQLVIPPPALLLPAAPGGSSRNVGAVKTRKAPERCRSLIPGETFENINKNDLAVVKHWWGPCSLTSIKTLGTAPWLFPAALDRGPLSCPALLRGWKRHKSSRHFHGGAPEPIKKIKKEDGRGGWGEGKEGVLVQNYFSFYFGLWTC